MSPHSLRCLIMATEEIPVPQGMQLLLYGDKETGRIIYAETNHDFGNLLISLLMKPAGSLLERLREQGVGAANSAFYNIFSSVDYWHSDIARIGQQKFVAQGSMTNAWSNVQKIEVKVCKGAILCQHRTTDNTPCKDHGSGHLQVAYSTEWTQGYMKEDVKLLVTDDLQVLPLNTASIALAQKQPSGEKAAALQGPHGVAVVMTKEQILRLIGATFSSTTILNDTFGETKSTLKTSPTTSTSSKELGGTAPAGTAEDSVEDGLVHVPMEDAYLADAVCH